MDTSRHRSAGDVSASWRRSLNLEIRHAVLQVRPTGRAIDHECCGLGEYRDHRRLHSQTARHKLCAARCSWIMVRRRHRFLSGHIAVRRHMLVRSRRPCDLRAGNRGVRRTVQTRQLLPHDGHREQYAQRSRNAATPRQREIRDQHEGKLQSLQRMTQCHQLRIQWHV